MDPTDAAGEMGHEAAGPRQRAAPEQAHGVFFFYTHARTRNTS
jgi:hypothetical protein